MAAASSFAFNSQEELLAALQEGQIIGRTAQWLKSHLVLCGQPSNSPLEERPSEIPTLYCTDCEPSVRNFMIVAWNRLFRYPHGASHVNGVVHGLHASGKSASFDLGLQEALGLFCPSTDFINAVKIAREGLKWALESTWHSGNRNGKFKHRTEAITSVQLLFSQQGEIVGTRFRLHWLSDCPFLVDPFEETSPTFALLHHFIAWIRTSEKELDGKIVGRNLKRFVANLDIEPGSEVLFRGLILTMQRFATQQQFKQLLQLLASLVHLQRVRANCDPEGNISLFNPDNLTIFATLLGIDNKELRYQLLTDISKTKLGFHGNKDHKQVNQDLLRIGVLLYRCLVTWLLDLINEKLAPEDYHASIELFDMPGLTVHDGEDNSGNYDSFCRNVVNEVMTLSAFEKRNEESRQTLMREGISLDLERPQYDDYLAFYFTQGKNESLLSLLSQEKTKKDHIQRLKKQIFTTFKTNQRISKVKEAKGQKQTIIGIRHASEDTVHYSLERLNEACSATVSSGLMSAIGESSNPIPVYLREYRNTAIGLGYSKSALMGLSDKLVSEKSCFIYCLPVHSDGALVERRHVMALHLFSLCMRQICDFSEVLSHQRIFENYTHVYFKHGDELKPSPETTRLTLDKLQIFGYISSRNVFLCEVDFHALQVAVNKYKVCVLNSQRFARGFLARRKLNYLKERAISYHEQLMEDLKNLRKACNLFSSIQNDYTNFIVEETDAELLRTFLRRSESARKIHKTAWGFCFVLHMGKQVGAFPLNHDLYWIFAKDEAEIIGEKNYVNLLSFDDIRREGNNALCDTFGDGFYFRKTSNNSLAVKRKTTQPMFVWNATKEYRRTVSPCIRAREGKIPSKRFVNVFDNDLFKNAIVTSLHTKDVSSRAIVGETVIPLIVGLKQMHSTIAEAPYCFVIVDLSIKDSLCLESFNKEIRAEVKRMKKEEREGDPKGWGRSERKDNDADIIAGAGTIHSLLIKWDHSLEMKDIDDKISDRIGRPRRKEKWSRKTYEKKKMEKQLQKSF